MSGFQKGPGTRPIPVNGSNFFSYEKTEVKFPKQKNPTKNKAGGWDAEAFSHSQGSSYFQFPFICIRRRPLHQARTSSKQQLPTSIYFLKAACMTNTSPNHHFR